MTYRILTGLALAAALSLSACNDAEKRTDGTAGEAVSDIDKAAEEGGVQADAVVIDDNAGPTVTPSAADSAALDKSGTTQP
ncbi:MULTISPECIES: hypothetical protein [Hymenobacter]|uniref:Secreted protein n=2 Tax=Hymenobacter TaxID=89966 RepID=A0ABS6X4P2_9BACT|nr:MULTISPECIES: hypothetical protein [Hymenobacter]MBO3271253.1 hypothetical protein [Hymenobacter defluvii]MBW3130690.1 hypothetical protein [Hymenobacter profundi]QNE41380.1 hypothetical protein F1C16_18365 [Hymenobacter sp. NBH84]